MSEQLSFDRKKGFVALPVEVLDIDLTPGAFRTLVELCRMANADGFCWPSLEQLSDRFGRSKSAISGYIKELRSQNLIDTQEQKTATGYNYRLKYRVTFWQEWRAGLRGKTHQKDERSVQPTERLRESKKHIHKNHTGDDLDGILVEWAKCFKGAPYPTAKHAPSEQLMFQSSEALERQPGNITDISADITGALTRLWQAKGIVFGDIQIREQADFVSQMGLSPGELHDIAAHIQAKWPSHWRQFPTQDQLHKLIKSSAIVPRTQKIALLRGYLNRWAKAQKTLQKAPYSYSLEPAKSHALWAAE